MKKIVIHSASHCLDKSEFNFEGKGKNFDKALKTALEHLHLTEEDINKEPQDGQSYYITVE